jgi:N-acetylmuramoyl-L-alanine amidase
MSQPIDYVVQNGDCFSSIAEHFGFFWKTLWDANPELKDLRKNPNVLMAGDVVHIPALTPREEQAPTDATHKYVKKGTPAKFRLIVERFNIPLRNRRYILEIDGKPHEGETDDTGMLEVFIDPAARGGILRMPDDAMECPLQFGYLDPLDELLGIQARLQNLGFYHGALDGRDNEELHEAVTYFQSSVNIEPTGQLDDATKQKLFDMHDQPHQQREEESAPPEEAASGDDSEPESAEDIDPEEDAAEIRRLTGVED